MTWVLLPIVIIGQFVYLLVKRKVKPNAYLILFIAILGCAAIPCFLFILVNKDIIEPIYTHVISIPEMLVMRSSEFAKSYENIKENFFNICSIVIKQSDGSFFNSDIYNYGMFYKFALPFWVVGAIALVRAMVIKIKEHKDYIGEFIVILYTITSFILCVLVKVNIVRSNYLWIYVIITIGYGCYSIAKMIPIKKLKNCSIMGLIVVAIYSIALISFEKYYFNVYSNILWMSYADGVGEAMDYAKSVKTEDATLYFDSSINYAVILFYLEQDPDVFRETAVYDEYPAAWVYANEWDGVKRIDEIDTQNKGVSVVRSELITDEVKASCEYEDFGRYGVVIVN